MKLLIDISKEKYEWIKKNNQTQNQILLLGQSKTAHLMKKDRKASGITARMNVVRTAGSALNVISLFLGIINITKILTL